MTPNFFRSWNLTDSCGGEVAQIMYTHVSKCKNDKTK
jgi:hypothetical protein